MVNPVTCKFSLSVGALWEFNFLFRASFYTTSLIASTAKNFLFFFSTGNFLLIHNAFKATVIPNCHIRDEKSPRMTLGE